MRKTAHRTVTRRTTPKRLALKRGMSKRQIAKESRRLIRSQVRATGIPTRHLHPSFR